MPASRAERGELEEAIRNLEKTLAILKHLTNEPRCKFCGITATDAREAGSFWLHDRVCSACQPTGPMPISFTPDVL